MATGIGTLLSVAVAAGSLQLMAERCLPVGLCKESVNMSTLFGTTGMLPWFIWILNTIRPEQNVCYCVDDILKLIFLFEYCCIVIQISLRKSCCSIGTELFGTRQTASHYLN